MYLYGASGHAKVVLDVLKSMGQSVSSMFDDDPNKKFFLGMKVNLGVKLVGQDSFPILDQPVIISIGDNHERAFVAQSLPAINYGIAVHPSAIVSSTASIGDGTVVLQGAILQADSAVGKHVLINTGASVDHECILGDYVHISPQAVLCGNVHVGEGTHVGAGAVIIPNLKIGRWCKIGAGAVVIRDVPDYTTVVGNPARVLVKI